MVLSVDMPKCTALNQQQRADQERDWPPDCVLWWYAGWCCRGAHILHGKAKLQVVIMQVRRPPPTPPALPALQAPACVAAPQTVAVGSAPQASCLTRCCAVCDVLCGGAAHATHHPLKILLWFLLHPPLPPLAAHLPALPATRPSPPPACRFRPQVSSSQDVSILPPPSLADMAGPDGQLTGPAIMVMCQLLGGLLPNAGEHTFFACDATTFTSSSGGWRRLVCLRVSSAQGAVGLTCTAPATACRGRLPLYMLLA
jgi:hypothetical protein